MRSNVFFFYDVVDSRVESPDGEQKPSVVVDPI